MMEITPADMLKEARRESGMRRGYYPRAVAAGKLSQFQADRQQALMDAIGDYLELAVAAEAETTEPKLF